MVSTRAMHHAGLAGVYVMDSNPFQNTLILTGPTGSGKTELALRLADRLGAEIVSMDSMALYRGMDIGTAKPTREERNRIAHHLIDVLDPWESASVAWWLDQAAACCRDIESRGKRVLIVGGTALYLKALLHGLFDGPAADEGVRRRLEAAAEQNGCAALHAELARVDPVAANRLHPNDVRRIVRALEVWELTGRPISAWQTQWQRYQDVPSADHGPRTTDTLGRAFWLDLPRAELYARIDERVQRMFAAGLVEEAAALRRLPHPLSKGALQALGYKEVFAHLDGQATLEATIRLVQTRSRNFAKRQLTWFRHLPGCQSTSRELTDPEWERTIAVCAPAISQATKKGSSGRGGP
jgi:tRNA dimethylallyltransferase